MTITNLKFRDDLIYQSYDFSFATRNHHLPRIDNLKLPKDIITSFAFNYFSEPEKQFIFACDAFNDTLVFRRKNLNYDIMKISTGRELSITIYDPQNVNNMRQFTIHDLSKFTGLCRKYGTQLEVEKMITRVFGRNNL